MKLDRRKSA